MERTYRAPAQAVFDAWTSEAVLRRWFHARYDWETTEAKVDLRVGGDVRVVMRDPHKDVEYGGGGEYTEIEPSETPGVHLVLGRQRQRQLIELEFEETDGFTTVRFTHSGLWDEEAVRSHEDGWARASTTCSARCRRLSQGDNRRCVVAAPFAPCARAGRAPR